MTSNPAGYSISTDAKVLINHWQALRTIIEEHTTSVAEGAVPSNAANNLFSDAQINDAFVGPYQAFLKQKLSAYALIARLRLRLSIQEDDSIKIKPSDLNDHHKIPDDFLKKYALSDAEKMQSALNELTKAHHQQWQDQLQKWKQDVVMALTTQNIPLTEIEIKELQDKEPYSELLNRLIEFKLEAPDLKKSPLNYSSYLKLKATLSIQSSLSRRHQPHTSTELNQTLKKIKSAFNQISQEEKKLLKTQQAETQAIVASIAILTP